MGKITVRGHALTLQPIYGGNTVPTRWCPNKTPCLDHEEIDRSNRFLYGRVLVGPFYYYASNHI